VDPLYLVDKPEGWTSHDVVARLRGILGERRVGHAGTLDPFATGLLIVAEGRATGLLGTLGLLPKRYLATVRLGVATDTQDRTGIPLDAVPGPLPSLEAFDAALARFRGVQEQRPPIYSAVKVGGERLYHAARRGEDVERPTRPIEVYALERVVDGAAADAGGGSHSPDVTIDVTVSRGTYVRTLAHDIGAILGCGAHLVALRRLSIGPFDVSRAGRVDREGEWDVARFRAAAIPPAKALAFLPAVRLGETETSRIRHGVAPVVSRDRVVDSCAGYPLPPGAAGWPIALHDADGSLLALAHPWREEPAGAPLKLQRVLADVGGRAGAAP